MSFPAFEIILLTPDDDSNYNSVDDPDDQLYNWMDDSECQENLFHIVPLTPEETTVDENNHIRTHIKLFFEELGYLTEEPEPIDPTRDYEAEAQIMLQERGRTRQKHIQLSTSSFNSPSFSYSKSGISSSSSSSHHDHLPAQSYPDVRSPFYMGQIGQPSSSYHLTFAPPVHNPSYTASPSPLADSCAQNHLNHLQHRHRQHTPRV